MQQQQQQQIHILYILGYEQEKRSRLLKHIDLSAIISYGLP